MSGADRTLSSGPRVGCGAAIVDDGKILLVKRRRPPEAGCWGLPGGKVDRFETVRAAAIREVEEELGVTVLDPVHLTVMELIDRGADEHWIAPTFRVERWEGTPRLMEPDKHEAFGWFPIDTPPAPLTEAARVALIALRNPPTTSDPL